MGVVHHEPGVIFVGIEEGAIRRRVGGAQVDGHGSVVGVGVGLTAQAREVLVDGLDAGLAKPGGEGVGVSLDGSGVVGERPIGGGGVGVGAIDRHIGYRRQVGIEAIGRHGGAHLLADTFYGPRSSA